MSAYKKLNKQDAFITTYTAHKRWEVFGNLFSSYGIEVIESVTGSYINSLQQLYYPTKISGSIISHSFDYYPQTTLYNSESRNSPQGSFLISIPRSLTGTYLNPGVGVNFLVNNVQQILYVSGGYWADEYTNDPLVTSQIDTLGIDDNGEGSLYISGSNPRKYVGDIIYTHGIIIITDPDYSQTMYNLWTSSKLRKNLSLSWESSQPIFTHNYHCKVRDFEYNYTYNPSAGSSSLGPIYDNNSELYSTSGSINRGDLNNNVTGSVFQPYITTVGLYNDANELIAVGKMAQPVPKSANTEMTIIVKIDI